MLQAAELMKQEAIGHVLHVDRQMHFVWQTVRMMEPEHWAQKLPGGRFFEANPHSLYLISQFVSEMKVDRVRLYRRSNRWPHVPITGFSALLSGHNREGDVASVNLTMSLDHEPRAGRGAGTQITVVHGTKGTMVVDGPACYVVDKIGSGSLTGSSGSSLARQALARLWQKFTSRRTEKSGDGAKGKEHAFMIGHFIKQVEGKETEPLVAWDEVLETQRVNDELGQAVERELSQGNVLVNPGISP
jgi:predicted dehydrogenase